MALYLNHFVNKAHTVYLIYSSMEISLLFFFSSPSTVRTYFTLKEWYFFKYTCRSTGWKSYTQNMYKTKTKHLRGRFQSIAFVCTQMDKHVARSSPQPHQLQIEPSGLSNELFTTSPVVRVDKFNWRLVPWVFRRQTSQLMSPLTHLTFWHLSRITNTSNQSD